MQKVYLSFLLTFTFGHAILNANPICEYGIEIANQIRKAKIFIAADKTGYQNALDSLDEIQPILLKIKNYINQPVIDKRVQISLNILNIEYNKIEDFISQNKTESLKVDFARFFNNVNLISKCAGYFKELLNHLHAVEVFEKANGHQDAKLRIEEAIKVFNTIKSYGVWTAVV